MIGLFDAILYYPLLNILIFIYNTVAFSNLGASIIILTVAVRFLIYPLSKKAIKSQKEMAMIQPLVKEIQATHKENREEQARALMALYKEHKVNPFAGLLPILVQIPVLMALFLVLRSGITPEHLSSLYSFISPPASVNTMLFGIFDLSKPIFLFALFVGATQFIQSKMMLDVQTKAAGKNKVSGAKDFGIEFSKQMTYIFPVVSIVISSAFSGGLSLYWTVSNLFSIFQQSVLLKEKPKKQHV